VAIEGNVGGLGKVQHRDFAMACGEMDREQFTAFLSATLNTFGPMCIAGRMRRNACDSKSCGL
jgi:hypothetical protein